MSIPDRDLPRTDTYVNDFGRSSRVLINLLKV